MTTGVIATAPILQFTLNNGQLAVNGSILTQVGGVNAATYQDSGLTTPLPNPIPLNSRGEISDINGVSRQLFLTPNTVYTFTLYDGPNGTGNLIWQAPYVNGVQLTGAAAAAALNPITNVPILNSLVQTAAEIAAGVTPTNYAYAPGTVDRYGTNTTPGTTDMTAAIQAAINQAQQTGGTPVILLAATYLLTTGVTISGGSAAANIHIYGQGRQTSLIMFNPPTNGGTVGINFTTGANATVLYRCSIERVGFQTNNTNQKTYIQLVDCSDCAINDVEILQLNTSISASIGIYLKGREMTRITDCQVQTEQPMRIGVNPNSASLSCDLLSIRNWKSTTQSGNAVGIQCDNNVNITNMNWDGYIHHSAGGGLFQYINTTAAQTSYNWKLGVGGSIRVETGSVATNFAIDIEMSAGAFVQDLTIANVYFGSVHNGIKLRGCLHPVIADSFNANNGGSRTILDADSSNIDVDVRGYYTSGTTPAASMGTLVMRNAPLSWASLQPIPPYSMWSSPLNQQFTYGQIGPVGLTSTFGFKSSATAPDPGNGGTIATASVSVARVTPAAARTGVILAVGSYDGQVIRVLNVAAYGSGFSITFAAVATSNVVGGTSIVVGAGLFKDFAWDATNNAWYTEASASA